MSRYALEGRRVLITGASAGIGQDLSLRWAKLGARLVLCARSEEGLEKTAVGVREAGGEALVVPADVTDPAACQEVVDRGVELYGGLDVAILNAGISMRGSILDCDSEAMLRVMRVNYDGSVHCFSAARKHLVQSGGQVVIVSSLTGKKGIPGRAAYSASKWALHGFFNAARIELATHGVHVLIVCPGFVDTEIRKRSLGPDGGPVQTQAKTVGRILTVKEVSEAILSGVHQRKREIVLPGLGRVMCFLDRVSPRFTDWLVSRMV